MTAAVSTETPGSVPPSPEISSCSGHSSCSTASDMVLISSIRDEAASPAASTLRHRRQHSQSPASDSSVTTCETRPSPIAPKRHKLIADIVERRVGPSFLDICDPLSPISRSEFKGMVVLIHVLCGLYLIVNPLYNTFEKGYLMEPTLAKDMFEDFFILMAAWATCFSWSFTAYILFKAMVKRIISMKFVSICQHTNQALLILGMIALIRWRQWAIFPSVFVVVVALIHYMKMHSYTSSTMDIFKHGGRRDFPAVCTFRNFFNYLLCPVLVYDTSYPRSLHSFRPIYFAQKLIHLVGSLALIYTVTSQMVIPVFETSFKQSPLHVWARLIVPLLLLDFLFFYMMFECILNLLAEITQWGDRSYYDDWWNCTTWDDFARKWNKPVHEFLLCHVYISTYRVTKQSKFYASVSTFLFSAILHETVLATCLGLVRFWMFGLMMCQIPMMAFSRYHKHTTFGNYYFWFGLLVGVPALSVLYGREWASMISWQQPTANGEVCR